MDDVDRYSGRAEWPKVVGFADDRSLFPGRFKDGLVLWPVQRLRVAAAARACRDWQNQLFQAQQVDMPVLVVVAKLLAHLNMIMIITKSWQWAG